MDLRAVNMPLSLRLCGTIHHGPAKDIAPGKVLLCPTAGPGTDGDRHLDEPGTCCTLDSSRLADHHANRVGVGVARPELLERLAAGPSAVPPEQVRRPILTAVDGLVIPAQHPHRVGAVGSDWLTDS